MIGLPAEASRGLIRFAAKRCAYDGDCIQQEFEIMPRFLFFVLVERHGVSAHTSSRPPAAAMPDLSA